MMKRTEQVSPSAITNVVCDRCNQSCNQVAEYGLLSASWGAGAMHAGENYELHLCEPCFFVLVSAIKRERWTLSMFTEDGDALLADMNFGQVDNPSGVIG